MKSPNRCISGFNELDATSSMIYSTYLKAGRRPKKATNVKKEITRTIMAMVLSGPMLEDSGGFHDGVKKRGDS